jgi:hypothetical protein
MGEESFIKEITNRLRYYYWVLDIKFINDVIVIFVDRAFYEKNRLIGLMNQYNIPYKIEFKLD